MAQPPNHPAETPEMRGFDSFEMTLGDELRGERATMGKSLLDVQRDLRIKASYIAAIEDCDLTVFSDYGFVAGYVRSYARYLGLNAENIYQRFCGESGFEGVNGALKQQGARATQGTSADNPLSRLQDDTLRRSKLGGNVAASRFDLGASLSGLASVLFLVGLIGGLGYGGWFVLQEVQRVTLAPVEQGPQIIAQADPVDSFSLPQTADVGADLDATPAQTISADDARLAAFDRLYAPQAVSRPVFETRDGPIATLDPAEVGALAAAKPAVAAETVIEEIAAISDAVDEAPVPEEPLMPVVTIRAAQAAWVRVRQADDSILFEKILAAGETYDLPEGLSGLTLRAGNSGSVFLSVGQEVFGPLGNGPRVAKNVSLNAEDISTAWPVAQMSQELEQSLGLVAQSAHR